MRKTKTPEKPKPQKKNESKNPAKKKKTLKGFALRQKGSAIKNAASFNAAVSDAEAKSKSKRQKKFAKKTKGKHGFSR